MLGASHLDELEVRRSYSFLRKESSDWLRNKRIFPVSNSYGRKREFKGITSSKHCVEPVLVTVYSLTVAPRLTSPALANIHKTPNNPKKYST